MRRRACTVCRGTGGITISKIINVARLPCDACLGTGSRVVQRSEQAIRVRGALKERRKHG